MATQKENSKLDEVDRRLGRVEMRVDEVIIPKLDKVVDFVDSNKSGIQKSTIFDNQLFTFVIIAIISAGVAWAASKGGV